MGLGLGLGLGLGFGSGFGLGFGFGLGSGLGSGLDAGSLAEVGEVGVRNGAQRVYPLGLAVEVGPMAQRLLEVLGLAPAD